MSQKFKRITAFLLCVALLLGTFATLTINVFATDEKENLKKGEFVFAPHTYTEGDLNDIYYYTDEVFSGSALNYNEHLATMSMILAASSISSQDPDADYEVKSRNLSHLLREWDFTEFSVNEYYTQKPQEQTMGVGIAYKIIGEGDNAYTLLAIVPRSAGYEKEWAGNFTVGKDGVHKGFATGRDIILDFAKQYVEENKDSFEGTVKVWTVGYSRGAGVANLLAAYLDDNSKALGIEVKKENIFAYAFGTPSTVQYANETEKASFETNYKNIHNRYSDYDIVTYAPFKNWKFTHYGTTKLFDVYNAEKKAEMLKFLENTNKTIYDLYVAEGSKADPDNFTPVMIQLDTSNGLGVKLVPADPAYGIPSNQRDFLDSRVAFLVENLVPDRATYVDGGYEYALQCLTSLYFGLDSEQSSLLIKGMSHNIIILAAAYYCYFISDFYLSSEQGLGTVSALLNMLPEIEQKIAGLEEECGTEEWYLYVKGFMASEKYLKTKATLEAISSNADLLAGSIAGIQENIKNFAVGITANVFESGISELTIDEAEKTKLLEIMTSVEVAAPLTDFLVYLLLGSEDGVESVFNPSSKNIALAATFLTNAGSYMRVHNNEIILSWLRTEDSYYADNDLHIHDTIIKSDENGHWEECECGYKGEVNVHAFGDWGTLPIKDGDKDVVVRSCPCGYEETKDAPVEEDVPTNKDQDKMETWVIVLICVGSAVALAIVVVVVIIIVKKRKSVK